jgi:hypothetical protein
MSTTIPTFHERHWPIIAEQLRSETDPIKILRLADELNRALEQQIRRRSITHNWMPTLPSSLPED